MKQTQIIKTEQEWLKVLGKGMITIPKVWRDELGIDEGEIVRAEKVGNRVILESVRTLPYQVRSYSEDEIDEFIKLDDKETSQLKKKGLL